MCTLICSRLAGNEGDQAAALGADARGSSLVRSNDEINVIEDADVTNVVVRDPGDEAVAALEQFARAERLEASQVPAIMVVTENPAELRKVMHPGLGIALTDLDRPES